MITDDMAVEKMTTPTSAAESFFTTTSLFTHHCSECDFVYNTLEYAIIDRATVDAGREVAGVHAEAARELARSA